MDVMQRREVDGRRSRLADVFELAGSAMAEATSAFVGGQAVFSTTLIGVERALRELSQAIDDHASGLVAASDRLAAADVRGIVAEVHTNANVEAMADMARQVADIAHSRPERSAPPEPIAAILRQMSQQSLAAVAGTAEVLRGGSAGTLDAADDVHEQVRQLQRRLLGVCPEAGLTVAIDATLVGRLYERFTEHVVSVGEQARVLAEVFPRAERG